MTTHAGLFVSCSLLAVSWLPDADEYLKIGGALGAMGGMAYIVARQERQIAARDRQYEELLERTLSMCSHCELARSANRLSSRAGENLLHK